MQEEEKELKIYHKIEAGKKIRVFKTRRKVGTGRQVVGTGRTIRKRIEAERKERKTTLRNCLGVVCC